MKAQSLGSLVSPPPRTSDRCEASPSPLAPYRHADVLWSAAGAVLVPILPFNMAVNGLRISVFAIVATFGTAQDVTADELGIATLFPAGAETEVLFRGAVSGAAR